MYATKYRNMFCFRTVIYSLSISAVCAVRVCKTFSDYNWPLSDKCFDNPTINQNISEIIRDWNFTAEEHYVTTEDGYNLLVERCYSNVTKESPVILVHGILMSAAGFIHRGNVSLAYLLGQLGYDVWLLSYRGTMYSKTHVNLTTQDNEYWKYSLDDLGIYDVRSTIKLVYNITKRKATYVGYSMGSTGFFIYSSSFPKEAKKYLKGMIALAPITHYAGEISDSVWPYVKPLVYYMWHGEIFPDFTKFLKPLLTNSVGIYFIQSVFHMFFGNDYDQMDPVFYPPFILQLTDTTAAEIYTHFIQLRHSGKFQKYDYGFKLNQKIYGQLTPPVYNVSKVPVPVALYSGENDFLADPKSTENLHNQLMPSSRCGVIIVPYRHWNHIDFISAKDVIIYLYNNIFDKINQINSEKC